MKKLKASWPYILFLMHLILFGFYFFKVTLVEYELSERKRDDFVIQTIYAILEGDKTFLSQNEIQLDGDPWRDEITGDFWVVKDTGWSYVEYLVYFDNGVVLYMDTFGLTDSFYGAGKFETGPIGPVSGEYTMQRKNLEGPFYLIGKHRIFPK